MEIRKVHNSIKNGSSICPKCNGAKQVGFFFCSICKKNVIDSKGMTDEQWLMYDDKWADEPSMAYPPHTEIYKNIHKLEGFFLAQLFEDQNWKFWQRAGLRKKGPKFKTKLEFGPEKHDVLYIIQSAAESKLKTHKIVNGTQIIGYKTIVVEYKSTFREHGKNMYDFINQIHNKSGDIRVLLSFDEKFVEWKEALKRTGIVVLVPKISYKDLLELTKKHEVQNAMFGDKQDTYYAYIFAKNSGLLKTG